MRKFLGWSAAAACLAGVAFTGVAVAGEHYACWGGCAGECASSGSQAEYSLCFGNCYGDCMASPDEGIE
jgi:hypothetical protein